MVNVMSADVVEGVDDTLVITGGVVSPPQVFVVQLVEHQSPHNKVPSRQP